MCDLCSSSWADSTKIGIFRLSDALMAIVLSTSCIGAESLLSGSTTSGGVVVLQTVSGDCSGLLEPGSSFSRNSSSGELAAETKICGNLMYGLGPLGSTPGPIGSVSEFPMPMCIGLCESFSSGTFAPKDISLT